MKSITNNQHIKKQNNNIGAIACIIVSVCFLSCSINFILKKLFPPQPIYLENISTNVKIDWEELYPFENNIDNSNVTNDITSNMTNNSGLYMRILNVTNTISAKINNIPLHIPKYQEVALPLGKRLKTTWSDALSRYVATPYYEETFDGYLVTLAKKHSNKDTSSSAKNVAELNKYCETLDIPLLYVECPNKMTREDEKYINSFINVNKDNFINALKSENVDVIDGRELVKNATDNHHSLFFYTDHHWTVETGLLMTSYFVKSINEKYNLELDYNLFDKNLYENKTYKNAMFGTQGHAFSHTYSDYEDFIIPIPKAETNFRFKQLDKNIDITGEWAEVMYSEERVLSLKKSGDGYAYEALMNGNRPLTQVTNLNSENDKKILVIGDSFALSVVPYLALSVEQIDLVDERESNGNFTGSIRNYIKQMQPDLVIMIFSNLQIGANYG